MIACRFMKVAENQRGRQWTDPEIVDGKPKIVEPRPFVFFDSYTCYLINIDSLGCLRKRS